MDVIWGIHNNESSLDLVNDGFISIGWEELGNLEEAGTASPRDLAAALLDACPPALTDASPPRLASGIVFTNDPEHATVLLSILAVGKESIEQLRRALPGSAF